MAKKQRKPKPSYDYVYRVTYFETKGGREVKFVDVPSNDEFMTFCARIRGLRDSGGQAALPGISVEEEEWNGPILISRQSLGQGRFHYLINGVGFTKLSAPTRKAGGGKRDA